MKQDCVKRDRFWSKWGNMNVSNILRTHVNTISSEIQLNSRAVIKGAVFIQGSATIKRHPVYLYDRDSMRLLQATRCDQNGNYSFHFLNPNSKFTVISKDIDQQFNAVIQDNVVPK